MRRLSIFSVSVAVALVLWVRVLPLSLAGAERGAEAAVRAAIAGERGTALDRRPDEEQPDFRGRVRQERERRRDFYSYAVPGIGAVPYLGGLDSYLWLRHARNTLRHGSPCDSLRNGECRDDFTLAPVGVRSRYASSLHVDAVVAMHRFAGMLRPDIPLPLSAYFVSVVAGAAIVIPAFLLGRRFGGLVGGFLCAILCALNPIVLLRSFGADNDVWNVLLPLLQVWAVVEAIYSDHWRRRAGFILAAAAATGLHAAIWGGWIFATAIVLIGLTANALLVRARGIVHGRTSEDRPRAAQAWMLVVTYLLAATVASRLAGAEQSPLAAVGQLFGAIPRFSPTVPNSSGELPWPSVFSTVGELRPPALGAIAASMFGPVYFFAGWLGLLLLMLPKSAWRAWHFAVFLAGILLYRHLLTHGEIAPSTLIGLLALPIVACGIGYLSDRRTPVADQGAGAIIILWFLAALTMAYRGNRFLILLAPPFAVAVGVAAGRLHDWVERQAWASAPIRAAVFVALLWTAYPPVTHAATTARNYVPAMNDAWHAALIRLRDETPQNAIVTTWWDYGYFVKYFAERRVLADGGTLRTRVHYWLAKALAAGTEDQTLGILRMLNCASDAAPEPEGKLGAFAALEDGALNAGAAHTALMRLTGSDRDEAEHFLESIGITGVSADVVLARTHCTPSPAYLLLHDELVRSTGWPLFANWDPLEAAATSAGAEVDPEVLADRLAEEFAEAPATTRDIVRRVAARGFQPTQAPSYASIGWSNCTGAEVLHCPITLRSRHARALRAVEFSPADPAAAALILASHQGGQQVVAPDAVYVVTDDGIRAVTEHRNATAMSVLIDPTQRRVLIGSAALLRSTLTHLLFLDGRFLHHFEPFDRSPGLSGDVRTWRIAW